MVVSTLEASPAREAEFFMKLLVERDLHLGALVLNKVLPDSMRDRAGAETAERLIDDPAGVAAKVAKRLGQDPNLARVLEGIGQNFVDLSVVAKREATLRSELSNLPDIVATVPALTEDVADLSGLLEIGEHLWA